MGSKLDDISALKFSTRDTGPDPVLLKPGMAQGILTERNEKNFCQTQMGPYKLPGDQK